MNDKEKKAPPPKIIGMVKPYWVELNSSNILSPAKKASKFPECEWKFDRSKMECVPGFEPASLIDNVVCVEYIEMNRVVRKEFGEEIEGIYQERSKVFDMMGDEQNGIILLHPNNVTGDEMHIERYLGRLGYEKNAFSLKKIEFEEEAIKDAFISEDIERRGIKLTENGRDIEFWTSTDLIFDEYYRLCSCMEKDKSEIDKVTEIRFPRGTIERIRVRIMSSKLGLRSPEIIIYRDRFVVSFGYNKPENWEFIRLLLKVLGVEGGGAEHDR